MWQTAVGLICLKTHERESITNVAGLDGAVCFNSSVSLDELNWWTVKGELSVHPRGSA